MIYILKMDNPKSPDDTGALTRVRLIGPFSNEKQATVWGSSAHANPHDNPCWQVVDLDDTAVEVVVPY